MKQRPNKEVDQIIDNELLKKEINEKYGGVFGEQTNLPPEVENMWLNSVLEFEKQYENTNTVTVWEFIGKPSFKSVNEISINDIASELEKVFDKLHENNIELSTLCDVESYTLYRFITEELFVHGMENIRTPSMIHCFTYEEFHPNSKLDIEDSIDYFFRATLGKKKNFGGEGYDFLYIDTNNYLNHNGIKINKQHAINCLNNFLDSFDEFEIDNYTQDNLTINEDETDCFVNFSIAYSGLFKGSSQKCNFKGDGFFKLKPSEYGGWDIYQIKLPGLIIN